MTFAWGKSDLLTYVKAFNAWRELRENRQGYAAEREFCSKYFLSSKTLHAIQMGRGQLADALAATGLCDNGGGGGGGRRGQRTEWERDEALNGYAGNVRVLRAVVCAAMYPHVIRIDLPDTKYEEVAHGTVAKPHNSREIRLMGRNMERQFLHPESVNFFEGQYSTRWLAYFARVRTSRLFVRDSTMVSPFALLLFGGDIVVRHERGDIVVDGWVIFKAQARVAVLAREVRRELDSVLLAKFQDTDVDLKVAGRAVTDAIIRLITTEG